MQSKRLYPVMGRIVRGFASDVKQQKKKPTAQSSSGTDQKKKGARDEDKEAYSIANFISISQEANKHKITRSVEDQAEVTKIAKEYCRQVYRVHCSLQKDLADKAWLQQEAIKALPLSLRKAALICDETPPPAGRPFPYFDTPPIKGFNPDDYNDRKSEFK